MLIMILGLGGSLTDQSLDPFPLCDIVNWGEGPAMVRDRSQRIGRKLKEGKRRERA